jgi:hypothetical protein
MNGPVNNFQLLFPAEPAKMHSVTGNAYSKIRIFFRMIHSLYQRFSGVNIDIYMMAVRIKISVYKPDKVFVALRSGILSERPWSYRESV